MKTKKVILKESDIKNIVEKVINELDWRTYASTYDKEKSNPARSDRFKDAASNAFNRQNGYGLTNIPRGDGDLSQIRPEKPNSPVYGGSLVYTPRGTQFQTVSGRSSQDGQSLDTVYSSQAVHQHDTVNRHNTGRYGDHHERGDVSTEDDSDVKKGTTLNPWLNYHQMRGDKQVRDFYSGKTKYTPGRGWHNESIIRSLTESIMEEIKKQIM